MLRSKISAARLPFAVDAKGKGPDCFRAHATACEDRRQPGRRRRRDHGTGFAAIAEAVVPVIGIGRGRPDDSQADVRAKRSIAQKAAKLCADLQTLKGSSTS